MPAVIPNDTISLDRRSQNVFLPRALVLIYLLSIAVARDQMVFESLHVGLTIAYVLVVYYLRMAGRSKRLVGSLVLVLLRAPMPLLNFAFWAMVSYSLWPALQLSLIHESGVGFWHVFWSVFTFLHLVLLALILRDPLYRIRILIKR